MNELIPVIKQNDGNVAISGRMLYDFLGLTERFSKWWDRMIGYGFEIEQDYTLYQKVHPQNKQTIDDYSMTLDMAKEIAMLQRNEKGRQARQYFLQLEKMWNSPEMIMKRALEFANKKVNDLQLQNTQKDHIIGELKPKATYYDLVLQSKSLLSVTIIAKDFGMTAIALNKLLHELGVQYKQGNVWLLYAEYQDRGYTQTSTHVIDDEKSRVTTKWTQKGRLFIYELLKKDRGILPIIEQEHSA